MNKQQFQRELEYGVALSIATAMLQSRLITQSEFCKIKAVLAAKYTPVICSLQGAALAIHPKTNGRRLKRFRTSDIVE
jgi:hypothetical protein